MVNEEFGENTNDEVEGEDSTDSREHQRREISAIDDANLFYKAVGGSKKGRLYGLGSKGHVLTTTKLGSFIAP